MKIVTCAPIFFRQVFNRNKNLLGYLYVLNAFHFVIFILL